jgi:ketosteroid isomerase-like protein
VKKDGLPAAIERFIAAANKGDVAAFLALFAADGVVDDWGRRFTGHAAIRNWSDEEFIGKQVSLKVTGFERNGDTVGVMADVGGNGFNGPSRFTFVLDGDRLREMRITAS